MALEDVLPIAAVVIVFLFAGPKYIPKLARSIGSARKEFDEGRRNGPPPSDTKKQQDESDNPYKMESLD